MLEILAIIFLLIVLTAPLWLALLATLGRAGVAVLPFLVPLACLGAFLVYFLR